MNLKDNYLRIVKSLENLKSIPLLLLRLVLAYGFYGPAKMKVGNIEGIISWFESINIPLPALNAYMATGTEALGVVLLLLGLGTRIISIPLIITMIVAIVTVHLPNGFEAGSNGFEIPLYYMIMLLTLVIFGSGKFSVDRILMKNLSK